jgi:hypothetical protein
MTVARTGWCGREVTPQDQTLSSLLDVDATDRLPSGLSLMVPAQTDCSGLSTGEG